MFERFTERARQVVVLAQFEARGLAHNYIGTEHLLMGLLREEEGLAARVLESLGVTLEEVHAQVLVIVGRGDEVVSGQIPFTPRAKKVLELALREALSLGHNYIGTEHVLLGLIRENQGVAARVLLHFDADAEKIRNRIIELLSGSRRGGEPMYPVSPGPPPTPVRPTTWEYLVERWPGEEPEARNDRLSELGSKGWQLGAVVPGGETSDWIFQRPSRPHRWTTAILGSRWTESAHALRVSQLEQSLAALEKGALEAVDGAWMTAVASAKTQLEELIERIAEIPDGKSEADPTFDDLVELVSSAKVSAIENQNFQDAASMRDLERSLVRLLAYVAELFSGPQRPQPSA